VKRCSRLEDEDDEIADEENVAVARISDGGGSGGALAMDRRTAPERRLGTALVHGKLYEQQRNTIT
jgi:hypothetical protein